MIYWSTVSLNQLGTAVLAEVDGGALCYLGLGEEQPEGLVGLTGRYYPTHQLTPGQTSLIAEASGQLRQYLAQERREFDLPLILMGSVFQRRVWDALTTVPFGQIATYGEIAAKLASPGAVRAVGQACGANPLPIIIPCHRVLAKTGLGGYSGGLHYKRMLLGLEGISA